VFQNLALKRIFGPKRDKVTGEWRKLHNEELNDLYCSSNIIRVIKSKRMGWACSMYGGEERCIQSFGGPEGKQPLGRPRRRYECNINMGLQEVGYGGMDWIDLDQDRDS
jgi:hypothetical protein